MIVIRPYIKNIVNEVRFASIATQYTDSELKSEKEKLKNKSKSKEKKLTSKLKKEEEFDVEYDNTVSINAETTINLFEDLNVYKIIIFL